MLDNVVISCIIFGIGIFGILCSFTTLYIIYKNVILHNAFGSICAIHSICELIILTIFTFWCAPVVLFNGIVQDGLLGVIVGLILTFVYFFSVYLHLLKSINRFCAIIFPLHYRTTFSQKHLIKNFIFIILISLLTSLPYFWYDYNFLFNRDYLSWAVRNEAYSNFNTYLDMGVGCINAGIAVSCDATTFCYLRYLSSKKTQKPSNHATVPREIKFFFQACMTSFLYTMMLISFHLLSRLSTNEWITFITCTVAWQLCHTLNELFFILFNLKHRKSMNNQITIKLISPHATK